MVLALALALALVMLLGQELVQRQAVVAMAGGEGKSHLQCHQCTRVHPH